jgi:putative heme-binding domain-containing protein
MRFHAVVLTVFLAAWPTSRAGAQPLVAETPPLAPAEEQTKFHLPPGFEIQLVAQEPEIHKPMNLAFDARGRLWVTHSLEYPFAAENDEKARDAVTVLSEFDANGLAQKVERFAEHLNIPIGLLPLSDKEAIAWSIPNIYRLVDSNRDGVADQKTVMFGPFGATDTHGDQNAFTPWIDGWVYANHGFSNDSRVKLGGKGPDVLHMQSGNTYRFRVDGSAIEQYSWGQVNPFGLSFDPLGNLFSADCHSSAVTMLLREGYYQSFGKPHDGLGFAPETTRSDHGGTGIAGVVYSTLPTFPPEYRDVLFVGNVITTRIHCDRLKWIGSTPVVTKVEDFLTSDDPWFRPVDIQPGPDGALYVADFYNCIIGHYEVPLTHPKRDRERGRIWRIVYTGKPNERRTGAVATPNIDLPKLDGAALFKQLADPNQTVRVLATNCLIDHFAKEAAAMANERLSQHLPQGPEDELQPSADSLQACHAVWLLQRTDGISNTLARKILEGDAPAIVQVHAARALGETSSWQSWHFDVVRSALKNHSPFVRRAAAEALSKHPAVENLAPLLDLLDDTDPQDAQLHHGIRISLRDQLRSPAVDDHVLTMKLTRKRKKQLVAFAASAPTGPSAILIFDEALRGRIKDEALAKALPVAAKHVDPPRIDAMVNDIEQRFAGNMLQQIALLRSLAAGLSERGLPLTDKLRSALSQLVQSALADASNIEWYNTPLPGRPAIASPWLPQQRAYRDGNTTMMISSLSPGGERLGGVLRSPTFKLPARLSFWMCGHNGAPTDKDSQRNYVRLVLECGTEAARSYPPREDIAQCYEWDLTKYVNRRGYVEVIDGITDLDGFAWLAVSRFEPAVITVPDKPVGEAGSLRAELYRMAGELKLAALTDEVASAANSQNENLAVRLAACEALVRLDAQQAVTPLAAILADTDAPSSSRGQAAQQLGGVDRPAAREALLKELKSAPESVAVVIGAGLAGKADSAAALLKEVREGRAPARLLNEPTVADRLKTSGLPGVDEQVREMTADLSPSDNRIAELIAKRRAGYSASSFSPEAGRAVFAKSVCANCHQAGGVGKTIGPALDGIGTRGLDRLLEDTLDPSRNVDLAFRSYAIETDSGQVLTGFGLRDEGATLAFNDSNGQPIHVPLQEVASRAPSTLSPMPTNAIEQIPENEFYSLLAYLLSLKSK